jgi:hypothetical protein
MVQARAPAISAIIRSVVSVSVESWFNILLWLLSAVLLKRRQAVMPGELYAARRRQLLLSAGYVFGCAFRSALPVYDVPRITLVDSWLSSVVVGRSVATFAELCFAGQWAFLLREIAQATGSGFTRIISRIIVPFIVVAETCSWFAVLTTWNLGHVAENSIWGLCAALLVTSIAVVWRRSPEAWRPLFAAWFAAGIAYVAFMFMVDVPMYWSRWVADEAIGRHYLTITQGLYDAATRRTVSFRWEDWKHEVPWMSLYFSLAVWISISFIHSPFEREKDDSKALSAASIG